MDCRLAAINRFTTGAGWPTSASRIPGTWSARWTGGCAADCARSAGRKWKSTAAKRHNLRIRGISERNARKWGGSSKGYWRIAGSQILGVALPNTYWDHLGLKP